MLLTNEQIYNYISPLVQQFNTSTCEIKMPVKINFFLQKNMKVLIELAQEIERSKMLIASTYGVLNTEGTAYQIPKENEDRANQELNDLFSIKQEVPLHIFKLEDFDGLELTFAQMNAIMFMIEE